MTITSNILRRDYTANGVNTTYAFDFPIFYESNDTLTDGVKNEPFQQSNGRNHSQSKPSFQSAWDEQQAINIAYVRQLGEQARAEKNGI